MYRSVNHIQGYEIAGSNDIVGVCTDLLFRDDDWTVSFAVADLGAWLPGKKVLIPRPAMTAPDWESRTIPVDLTTAQIKDGPTLEMEQPVSKEYQRKCEQHFCWPKLTAAPADAHAAEEMESNPLRSFNEVKDYQVRGDDGDVMGCVSDMLIDDEHWIVRYFVVDTGSWLPGKKVLVAPRWVQDFRWSEQEMQLDIAADVVRSAPGYDPAAPINRVYEERLYDAYGKPVSV